jgi:hypothetical protein
MASDRVSIRESPRPEFEVPILQAWYKKDLLGGASGRRAYEELTALSGVVDSLLRFRDHGVMRHSATLFVRRWIYIARPMFKRFAIVDRSRSSDDTSQTREKACSSLRRQT